jgi:phospholipid transport system substrate-binding protein
MLAMRSVFTRSILAFVFCTGLLCTAPQAQAADPGEEAREALRHNVDGIITLLSSAEFKDPQTRPQVRGEIEALIRQSFDYEEFAMRTVGPRWRSFNDDQRHRFAEAFAALLRSSYMDQLESYNGEKVEYADERASSDGSRVEVQTFIVQPDKKIPVAYRMLHKDRWVVYDVLVEGISLVKNYRTQFQELLRKESPDELITRIIAKAEEVGRANGN